MMLTEVWILVSVHETRDGSGSASSLREEAEPLALRKSLAWKTAVTKIELIYEQFLDLIVLNHRVTICQLQSNIGAIGSQFVNCNPVLELREWHLRIEVREIYNI